MKHEIKAKTNVQLLSIGKILQTGQTHIHEGELPDESPRYSDIRGP